MKRLLLILALALLPPSANADKVFQYVEVGEGRIYLAPRCLADSVNECNCAIAGPGVVPSFEYAFMCWAVEGKKIIFTSDKYRFEKATDEIQTEIAPDADDKPEEPVPLPENS